MKHTLIIRLSLFLLLQVFILTIVSGQQYRYDKASAQEGESFLLEVSGLKSKDMAHKIATVANVNQNQILLMARAGMSELAMKKLITIEEHSILLDILHDEGYNASHYKAFISHDKFSTEIAADVFQSLKEITPVVTTQKRKKRGRKWFKGIAKIIGGIIGAIDGFIKGGVEGAAKGYLAGSKAMESLFESGLGGGTSGNGVKPGPNGEGDLRPAGGFPF